MKPIRTVEFLELLYLFFFFKLLSCVRRTIILILCTHQIIVTKNLLLSILRDASSIYDRSGIDDFSSIAGLAKQNVIIIFF